MISAQNLTKRFGSRTVVSDVSFTVEPGRVTGFLGPNGAGTSMSALAVTLSRRAGRLPTNHLAAVLVLLAWSVGVLTTGTTVLRARDA